MMSYADALAGTWHPRDGLADPYAVVQGYIASARRLQATCQSAIEVTGIATQGGRVTAVETNQGVIATPVVINAAGAWAGAVGRLAGVDIPVVPVRRQIFVTSAVPELPADFPMVIEFARSLYLHREGSGILSGMTNHDEPPSFDQHVDKSWELKHLAAACQRFPALKNVGIASRWAGLYETSPDAYPILGAVEELRGFYCIAGFSGHGFMHGAGAGLLLAEEVLDGKASSLDTTSLRLSRFKRGATTHAYDVI